MWTGIQRNRDAEYAFSEPYLCLNLLRIKFGSWLLNPEMVAACSSEMFLWNYKILWCQNLKATFLVSPPPPWKPDYLVSFSFTFCPVFVRLSWSKGMHTFTSYFTKSHFNVKSYLMWCCHCGERFLTFWRSLLFSSQGSSSPRYVLPVPWRGRHHDPSKQWEPLSQWDTVLHLLGPESTTVRTSNLLLIIIIIITIISSISSSTSTTVLGGLSPACSALYSSSPVCDPYHHIVQPSCMWSSLPYSGEKSLLQHFF